MRQFGQMRLGGGRRGWILRYSMGALLVYGVWLFCMLISGRTLLCHSDAYLQQYPTLLYTARAVRGLLSGQGFAMVDFSLGQGLDTLASLGFYGLTNPFYWLAALFSGVGLEIYYHLLVFLYSWLMGLLFGLYLECTELLGRDEWAISAGGLMFAFCGYNTAGLLKVPYFAAGGMGLCLMLMAVERCLRRREWLLLSLSTLLALIVNFYLGYQTLLLTAAYVLLRLVGRLPKRGWPGTVIDGSVIATACLAGVCLSGFMLLPTMAAFRGSGRAAEAAGYTASLWHYPAMFYRQLAACFAAPYSQAEYWTELNFLPWTIAGLLALFASKDRRGAKLLRTGFLLALAGLCVPLCGKLFNGLSYVTNRWSYGFAFACCLCAAVGLPELLRPGFTRRRAVAAGLALWAAVMVAMALTGTEDSAITLSVAGLPLSGLLVCLGAALLLCVAGFLLLRNARLSQGRAENRARRFVSATLALCCLAYTAGYGVMMFSGQLFYRRGLDAAIAGQPAAKARLIGGTDFGRVDVGFGADSHAELLDYHGTGYYWSIVPGAISDYYTALEAPELRWVFYLGGLGGDPYLEAAAAVKDAVRRSGEAELVPYGFEPAGDGLYENGLALPMGLFFRETLSEAAWDQLSPLEKRQALLSAAILEDGVDVLPSMEHGARGTITFESAEGLEMSDTGMRGRAGDMGTLRYEAPEGSLCWLWLRDIHLISGGNSNYLQLKGLDQDGARLMFYISKPGGNYYYDQRGVFLYLGESKGGPRSLTLRLEDDGAFEYSGMEIVTIPAERYARQAEALRAEGWSPTVEQNRISGAYTAPARGVLQIAAPWSTGWRALVDGESAPLVRSGGMYMGLKLEPGEHEIELQYETPLIRQGVAVSLAALALIAAARLLQMIARRRRRV